jgi:hypothetical protein
MAVEIYYNDEQMNHLICRIAGVRAAVKAKVNEGGARAEAVLARHKHRGHARIVAQFVSVDGFVSLDDTRGQRAAAAIEYGRSGGRGGATQGIGALAAAFGGKGIRGRR